ncbi:MAG TPA: L-threonylcarbamoyladenylate synthase [Candidatus Polarisedimenticolia bacterium]|jgi:L-threonylcarbamoyladenylate synthase|nr:L-threonylcarbamoyladenylate synthase [Candidatus Polarisedimenticolia bacterium]
MKTLRVSADGAPDPEILREGIEVLSRGGVLLYPTDTVYALGCDPRLSAALRAMFRLKQRPFSRKVPFVAADVAQVGLLARMGGKAARDLAQRFWPGPLTLVLPLEEDTPLSKTWDWGPSIALRVPASGLARALASGLGVPLPATSANLSGEPAVSHLTELNPAFLQRIDLVLDAGPLPELPPSTIVDLAGAKPRILREGAIPSQALEAYLSPS